jgi:hypothetical protein
MKTLISVPGFCTSLISRNYICLLQTVVTFLIIFMLTGCANFYKINTTKGNTIDTITDLIRSNRRFIIHLKDTSVMLFQASIFESYAHGRNYSSKRHPKYVPAS